MCDGINKYEGHALIMNMSTMTRRTLKKTGEHTDNLSPFLP
jgi:hypothetical protein